MEKDQMMSMAKVLLAKSHQDALDRVRRASERLEITEGRVRPHPTVRQPKRAIYGRR